MTLHLHLSAGFDDSGREALRRRLPGFAITHGPDPHPDTEIWATGSASSETLGALQGLRSIVVPWAGVPEKLVETLASRPQISLHNLHHNADATAEMALALLLSASRQLPRADQQIREGCWGMRFGPPEPTLLHGRTALVLGCGSIGIRVARICRAMGMRVHGVRRAESQGDPKWMHGFDQLSNLLAKTHALIITAPLTRETRGMIGARELARMPAGGILVNVGRGAIVDEEALFGALKSGHLAAAGIDTWYTYPKGDEACLPSRFPFHEMENVTMSPHRGGAASQVEGERVRHMVKLVKALAGGDQSFWRVDLAKGY